MKNARRWWNGTVPMTVSEALAIRKLHGQGKPVFALELQEAVRVLSRCRERKPRMPPLSPAERHRVNGTLLYRLGLELGRIEGRRAA